MTNFVMPPPEESTQLAIMALSSYVLFAAAAGFVEKKWGQPARA